MQKELDSLLFHNTYTLRTEEMDVSTKCSNWSPIRTQLAQKKTNYSNLSLKGSFFLPEERGRLFVGGGGARIFWGSQREGPVFFIGSKGGPEFVRVTEGGMTRIFSQDGVLKFFFHEGGPEFFLRRPRGDQNFFLIPRCKVDKFIFLDFARASPQIINGQPLRFCYQLGYGVNSMNSS